MSENQEATITIDEVVTRKPDFVKLKAQGKTFNCNVKKYLQNASDGNPIFSEGRKLDVVFNEYQPEGQKFASRYINECRPSTSPNMWEDKAPYQGGGSKSYSGNGSKPKGEFRTPDQIMRGEACTIVARMVAPTPIEKVDGGFVAAFLQAVDEVETYIKGSLADHVAAATELFDAKPEADDDIPF